MIFRVTRTSVWDDEAPPCEGLTKTTTPYWDRRTFKTPEEHDAKLKRQEKWFDRGTEHGTWDNDGEAGIQRRLEDHVCWVIDIPDLDALMEFVKRHGHVVVQHDMNTPEYPELEIYDDYRE